MGRSPDLFTHLLCDHFSSEDVILAGCGLDQAVEELMERALVDMVLRASGRKENRQAM